MHDQGPFRTSARPQGKPCPRCVADALALTSMPIGDVPTERCVSCRGVWLTAATFNELRMNPDWQQAILGDPGLPSNAPDDSPGLTCPDCAQPMRRANLGRVSGIIVDSCRKHGIWSDIGELRGAVDFMTNRARHHRPVDDQPTTAPARPYMPFHVAVVDFFLELLSWTIGTPR